MINPTEKFLSHRQMIIAVTIFFFLCNVYMLFYNANWAEFGDPPYLYNITASLVRYQDTQFDLMAFNYPQRPDNVFFVDRLYPLFDYGEDLLSVTLAMPLYWLAFNIDGVGLAQTVWLFNVFVVALSGAVLFIYVLALGYNERTALVSALAFGLTTAIVPYAKTYMQEPIALLITLMLALMLEQWRISRYRNWKLLLTIPILLFALFHSKFSAPAAIPGLIVIAFPYIRLTPQRQRTWRTIELILFFGVALFIVSTSFINLRPIFSLFTTFLPDLESPYIMEAMRTYYFSVSASIWGTSPLVLLAIPGIWLLYTRGQTRYIWVGLLIFLGYTFGYAVLRGESWYGSVTWAPRFLIPTIPYWILLSLPAINSIVNQPRSRLFTGSFIVLFLYGIWIQFNGISYHWEAYDKLLPQGMILGQGNTSYDPTLMPWVLLPQKWDTTPLDIVWIRMNLPEFPLAFGILAFICLGWIIFQLRSYLKKIYTIFVTVLLATSFLLIIIVALPMIHDDPLYHGYNNELHNMLSLIEEETQPPDIVFITGAEHIEFMFNYGDIRNARLVGLPFQPGEQYSPEQPPLIESITLNDEMFNPTTIPLLQASAQQRDRLWLLTEFSSFHWWARRPIEHYMATVFYPVQEISTAPSVRLIEFATGELLETNHSPITDNIDFVFGDSIRLIEYTLPLGNIYSPGEILPITLAWLTDTPLTDDYTIALFLSNVSRQQFPIQGWDTQPQLGFAPTSNWNIGEEVVDNRAIRLPYDLQAGEYELWVRLYRIREDETLEILPVTGSEILNVEGDIAILPVTIEID